MSLNISSNKIGNPLLIELLRLLCKVFHKAGLDFFVIGATARDIVLQVLANATSHRSTRDLDIAIAMTGWDKYQDIRQLLIEKGFRKAADQAQRFYFKEYELDVVPYGALAKEDDNIYWPPDEEIAMSVKGFEEVLNEAITISIDEEFSIKLATLHGLFILKLNAWKDRNLETNKDAEDMWYIIDNYYFANEGRNIHPEVYEFEDFDLNIAGSYWLAHDIADLLPADQLRFWHEILAKEIRLAEGSRLIMQIIETNNHLSFSETLTTIATIVKVFENRLEI